MKAELVMSSTKGSVFNVSKSFKNFWSQMSSTVKYLQSVSFTQNALKSYIYKLFCLFFRGREVLGLNH